MTTYDPDAATCGPDVPLGDFTQEKRTAPPYEVMSAAAPLTTAEPGATRTPSGRGRPSKSLLVPVAGPLSS